MWDDWAESPRVCYGEGEHEGATFIRVCPKCGRFVKSDETVRLTTGGPPVEGRPNGTCKIHGRIEMPFEGYI